MRGQLTDLVRPIEDVASVYIGLDIHDLPARWRRLEASLLAQGAPAATVELIDEFLRRQPMQPHELAVFAAAGELRWYLDAGGAIRFDRAAYGSPPLVLPLLELLAQRPAYVEVVVDRLGAEITSVVRGASTGTTVTIDGPDDEITRGGPRHGDHPKFERRAVSSWEHNAAAVAAAAAAALKRADAELLLVAGQPRIVKEMLGHLPHGQRVVTRLLPGGRSPDGSEAVRRAALSAYVAAYVADHVPHCDTPDSVRGVADTLRALTAGRVRCLLVTDDPSDERTAWFGPEMLCSDTPAPDLRQGRLSDVAVRAALLTDAEVQVVEGDQLGDEGIGALCRFG